MCIARDGWGVKCALHTKLAYKYVKYISNIYNNSYLKCLVYKKFNNIINVNFIWFIFLCSLENLILDMWPILLSGI